MRLLLLAAGTTLLFSNASAFAPNALLRSRTSRTTQSVALRASNANEIVPLKKGSSVALVTPMTSTGQLELDGLRKLLQFHVEAGTDNLCILGTTGEASVMTMEERAAVLTVAVEEVKGKIPILVGTGTIDPEAVKAMTMQAIDLGCDASLVVSPYYVKPPQRGLIRHFVCMADLGLPVVIYNVPGRTGVDVSDESIALCAEHENVVGLKDATGKPERVESMRKLVGDSLLLYSGDDGTSLEYVQRGGDGCISVTANVAPSTMHQIMMAALRGDTQEAEQLNEPLKLLHKKLFVESNPIPTKWAAKRMGLMDSAYCRPPLDEMDPKFEADVEDALKSAGLI